ncbi:MAG: DNA ligase [Candidatus Anammoxibacter sp.]
MFSGKCFFIVITLTSVLFLRSTLDVNYELRAQSINTNQNKKTPVMLAYQWEDDIDVTGWWMSEKLDGVRAYWNGSELLSRSGNVFTAPEWFVKDFPDTALDGELWIGRQKFSETVSVVRKKNPGKDWKNVIYCVFDAPLIKGVFEERLDFLYAMTKENKLPFIKVVRQDICRGNNHVNETLKIVELAGGEGLILRKPGSLYQVGRSHDMLKVKSFHDMEAVVIALNMGSGRNEGRLGSLLVELPDGTQFSIGSGFTDPDRENPPAVGSVITFKYTGFTKSGIPKFTSFLCVREDI